MATLSQLKEAIIKADAAGNTEDARVLAKAIRKIQTQLCRTRKTNRRIYQNKSYLDKSI